jgi:large subunit ribosomal protein L5
MSRLLEKYRQEVKPALQKEFNLSPMAVPHMTKIIVTCGLGQAIENPKLVDIAKENIAIITGQMPVVTRSKKAISGFKLRQNQPIGLKVTLRKHRMYEFFDRFVNASLGRIRDFRGISPRAFDKSGQLNIGIREHTIFPEISFDKTEVIHGLQINIVFSGHDISQNRRLMELMGLPFEKKDK